MCCRATNVCLRLPLPLPHLHLQPSLSGAPYFPCTFTHCHPHPSSHLISHLAPQVSMHFGCWNLAGHQRATSLIALTSSMASNTLHNHLWQQHQPDRKLQSRPHRWDSWLDVKAISHTAQIAKKAPGRMRCMGYAVPSYCCCCCWSCIHQLSG